MLKVRQSPKSCAYRGGKKCEEWHHGGDGGPVLPHWSRDTAEGRAVSPEHWEGSITQHPPLPRCPSPLRGAQPAAKTRDGGKRSF